MSNQLGREQPTASGEIITDAELVELERLEEYETGCGPFRAIRDEAYACPWALVNGSGYQMNLEAYQYAAAAMNALPRLINEIRAARAEVARLTAEKTSDGEGLNLYTVALGDSRNTISGGVLGYEDVPARCAEGARLIVERRGVPFQTVQFVGRGKRSKES